jgi:hypothetical protein
MQSLMQNQAADMVAYMSPESLSSDTGLTDLEIQGGTSLRHYL